MPSLLASKEHEAVTNTLELASEKNWQYSSLSVRPFWFLILCLGIAHGLSLVVISYTNHDASPAMATDKQSHHTASVTPRLSHTCAEYRSVQNAPFTSSGQGYALYPGAAHQAWRINKALPFGDIRPLPCNDISALALPARPVAWLADAGSDTPEGHRFHKPRWLALILFGELLLLAPCVWFVARRAVRPLVQLAHAADAMNPGKKSARLIESGPAEMVHAAKAFNAMQDRISAYIAKRAQVLGAISHDLKTPITRMRLRTEAMEHSISIEKLTKDLCEMERLVCDGLAYARSGDNITRPLCRVNLDDFLDSLVCDYRDIGKNVHMNERCIEALTTHPDTLRRIVANLVDNALKYSGAAEIMSYRRRENSVSIFILDRGMGIPQEELEAVLQPFYRLENPSTNKPDGSGLGLAIAHQLTSAIGGSLILSNRAGGGLSAEIRLCSAKTHCEYHVAYAPHSQDRPSSHSLPAVVS